MTDDNTLLRPSGSGNIMLSASGRRVALLRALEQATRSLGIDARVIATDITRTSPAFQVAGQSQLVPPYSDPNCLEILLQFCDEQDIGLIIPTIDPDLPFFSKHREQFDAIGTRINVSSEDTIRVANDKWNTHRWLTEHGFPTVRQAAAEDILSGHASWDYPVFAKPRRGAASIGAGVVQTEEHLRVLASLDEYIVQSLAKGREYTVDVFVDAEGRCRCAVPRMRIETRGGEVSKGITRKCQPVLDLAIRVAESLPGARGVMNIQIMYDDSTDDLNVIEINPRFGGGYPLTEAAGAPMIRWVIEESFGLPSSTRSDTWRENVVMLRYDEAVFVSAEAAGME